MFYLSWMLPRITFLIPPQLKYTILLAFLFHLVDQVHLALKSSASIYFLLICKVTGLQSNYYNYRLFSDYVLLLTTGITLQYLWESKTQKRCYFCKKKKTFASFSLVFFTQLGLRIYLYFSFMMKAF